MSCLFRRIQKYEIKYCAGLANSRIDRLTLPLDHYLDQRCFKRIIRHWIIIKKVMIHVFAALRACLPSHSVSIVHHNIAAIHKSYSPSQPETYSFFFLMSSNAQNFKNMNRCYNMRTIIATTSLEDNLTMTKPTHFNQFVHNKMHFWLIN